MQKPPQQIELRPPEQTGGLDELIEVLAAMVLDALSKPVAQSEPAKKSRKKKAA